MDRQRVPRGQLGRQRERAGLAHPAAGPFDFDSFAIRSDAKPTLVANSKGIQDNSGWGVVTARVTPMSAAARSTTSRWASGANSVKRYLLDLGVPSSRLAIVSFGEAKPARWVTNESAWRYNRRVEFTVVHSLRRGRTPAGAHPRARPRRPARATRIPPMDHPHRGIPMPLHGGALGGPLQAGRRRVIFTLSGGHIMPLYDGCLDEGIRSSTCDTSRPPCTRPTPGPAAIPARSGWPPSRPAPA